MDDLPIPESAAEGLVIGAFVVLLVALWYWVRRTRDRHEREYWERRRRNRDGTAPRLPEPDDPRRLPPRGGREDGGTG